MTAQIKNNLISRINESKDLNFLEALQTIFVRSGQELCQLSSEQKDSVLTGKRQIKNGQISSNESVISEMREWVKKQ